jgi:cytochrome b561
MPDSSLADAIRAPSGRNRYRFDGMQMALHWLTFLLVVGNYLLARAWGFLPKGSAPRHELQSLHISIGVLFAAVLVARILWRAGPARRPLAVTRGIDWLASNAVHYLLYALLIVQVVFGFLWAWVVPEGFGVFGLFTIPSPASFTKADGHFFGNIHATVANVILIVAGLHAAAALFHQFLLRDGLLWRIIPGRGAPRPAGSDDRTR